MYVIYLYRNLINVNQRGLQCASDTHSPCCRDRVLLGNAQVTIIVLAANMPGVNLRHKALQQIA